MFLMSVDLFGIVLLYVFWIHFIIFLIKLHDCVIVFEYFVYHVSSSFSWIFIHAPSLLYYSYHMSCNVNLFTVTVSSFLCFRAQFDHVVIVSFMVCSIFDHFLISFYQIDILYIGFVIFDQFTSQFYHVVIVVTWFCVFCSFSHQVSAFDFFLPCSVSYFIIFVVCFFEMMFFTEKWDKCILASSVSRFLVLTTMPELCVYICIHI